MSRRKLPKFDVSSTLKGEIILHIETRDGFSNLSIDVNKALLLSQTLKKVVEEVLNEKDEFFYDD
jgi:hypothetical protein